MARFKKVSTVIFDLDGTLMDTEGIYANVIATIAKRFGKIYSSEIMGKVAGTVEHESARIAVTEMQLPMQVDEFQEEFRKNSQAHFLKYGAALMPGAQKLVLHLSNNKVPMSIATSSHITSFKIKTAKHKELFKLFDHVVCGGSDPAVKNGKPAPDIFLVSASRFPHKPKPEKILVLEDAVNGVRAAKSAGMQVIMFPDKHVPLELQKEATLALPSMEEVPLEQFGLPPFN